MIERFCLTMVTCNKCKKSFQGGVNLITATKADMEIQAEELHKHMCETEKLLCFAPQLVIFYTNVLDCTNKLGKEENKIIEH